MTLLTRLFVLALCASVGSSELYMVGGIPVASFSQPAEEEMPEVCINSCPCEENSNPPYVTIPGPSEDEYFLCINGIAIPATCNNGFHYSYECMSCQPPGEASAVTCKRDPNCNGTSTG